MTRNLNWQERAACVGIDSRTFFADGKHAREQVNAARRICADCPVRTQCAAYAIETGEKWGVWGGMSQQELRQRRRRLTTRGKLRTDTPQKREPAKCGTNSGYRKHVREKTPICEPCRRAHADADARLRRTGTTRAAA